MKTDVDYILGDALPEPGKVIEVAPGILWVRMPLPFALDHVNLYLLDDGDGWVLVDTGIANEQTQGLWTRILDSQLGGKPITQVIVTHFHPDHMGNAGWMLERTGAPLWMSRTEWLSARAIRLDDTPQFIDGVMGFYRKTGLSDTLIHDLHAMGNTYRRQVSPVPMVYQRLCHETALEIAGRRWIAVIGGGHSPEHVCLYCAEDNVILGGDFLLPRISPNVSVWWNEPDSNPLSEYLRFLASLSYLKDDVLVLPSHDRPYRGLTQRRADLATHHEERFDLAVEVCRRPSTAAEVMTHMFRRQLDAHQSRFAIGESLSHLNYLVEAGRLNRTEDTSGVWRYEATG